MALTNEQLVTELYIGYFDRAPDAVGLNFWVTALNNGVSLLTVANDFANSTEAQTAYPFLVTPTVANPAPFVTQVYQNVLNRAPDAAGLAFWDGELATGAVTPGGFILALEQSVNAQTGTPDALTLANKVTVGVDFAMRTANVPLPNTVAEAKIVEAGVTNDPATVTAAEALTTAFIAQGGAGGTFTIGAGTTTGVGITGPETFNAAAGAITSASIVTGNGNVANVANLTLDNGTNLLVADIPLNPIVGTHGFNVNAINVSPLLTLNAGYLAPVITGISTVNVTTTGAGGNLDLINSTGVTTVGVNGTGDFALYDINPATLTAINVGAGYGTTGGGSGAAHLLSLNFAGGGTTSASAHATETLNLGGADDIALLPMFFNTSSTIGPSGVPAVNLTINSGGTTANTVELGVVGTVGTFNLATLNALPFFQGGAVFGFPGELQTALTITGAENLTLQDAAFDFTNSTPVISGTAFTGALTLDIDLNTVVGGPVGSSPPSTAAAPININLGGVTGFANLTTVITDVLGTPADAVNVQGIEAGSTLQIGSSFSAVTVAGATASTTATGLTVDLAAAGASFVPGGLPASSPVVIGTLTDFGDSALTIQSGGIGATGVTSGTNTIGDFVDTSLTNLTITGNSALKLTLDFSDSTFSATAHALSVSGASDTAALTVDGTFLGLNAGPAAPATAQTGTGVSSLVLVGGSGANTFVDSISSNVSSTFTLGTAANTIDIYTARHNGDLNAAGTTVTPTNSDIEHFTNLAANVATTTVVVGNINGASSGLANGSFTPGGAGTGLVAIQDAFANELALNSTGTTNAYHALVNNTTVFSNINTATSLFAAAQLADASVATLATANGGVGGVAATHEVILFQWHDQQFVAAFGTNGGANTPEAIVSVTGFNAVSNTVGHWFS